MSEKKCEAPNCDKTNNLKENRVHFRKNFNMVLCEKHNLQLLRHGIFLEQSRCDKNKIEIDGDIARVYYNNKSGSIIGFFIIDTEDIDLISKYKWFKKKDGRMVANVTMDKSIGVSHIRVHNLVMGFRDFTLYNLVDHIDRDPLNNTKKNLRITDSETNIINRGKQKNNTSGITGVVLNQSGNYVAQLKYKRKMMRFGTYANIEDAIIARLNAEAIYFKMKSVNCDNESNRIKILFLGKAYYSSVDIDN